MRMGPLWRTMRVLSRRISSTSRGSFSVSAARRSASADGVTVSSDTTRPSAFETIFCVTTTTSPDSMPGAGFGGLQDKGGEVVAFADFGEARRGE